MFVFVLYISYVYMLYVYIIYVYVICIFYICLCSMHILLLYVKKVKESFWKEVVYPEALKIWRTQANCDECKFFCK